MKRKSAITTAASLLIGVVAGTGLMMNDQVYQSVQQVVGGSATNNSLSGIDLSSMDIEAALAAVQQQRQAMLDNQLNEQMEAVKNRNDEIAQLNKLLNELDQSKQNSSGDSFTIPEGIGQELAVIGINAQETLKAHEIEKMKVQLRSKIDANSNEQQMDMLKLQSMTEKQNEAFKIMSETIKKMEEARSSIIGNMR